MPIVRLTDRAVVNVSGPDAEHLLQNVITTDLDTLDTGAVKPGALLAPQGKILFDFLVSRTPEAGFRLDMRADVASDFAKRMMLYRLRAKAEIVVQEQADVTVSWDIDSAPSENDSTGVWLIDTRFRDASVRRSYESGIEAGETSEEWTRLRIAHGIAESGLDYALGDAFPHDVLLDQNGGVGFKKGCYVGQEVVSRMQHRGTARRRVLIATAHNALPAPGIAITADEREVGTLGSVAGADGLAVVRIDRVKDAMDSSVPLLAAGVELSLAIPEWATFTFPTDA